MAASCVSRLNFVRTQRLIQGIQRNVCPSRCAPAVLQHHRCAPAVLQHHIRGFPSSKHYDPKFRKQRGAKVFKMDLPDFNQLDKDAKLPPDEMRIKLKKEGRLPPRTFQERQINIAATGTIFEEFVPPEGDGKSSLVSKEGASQKAKEVAKKVKSRNELRKLRQYETDFDTKEFPATALEIFIDAQKLLEDVKKNEERLHDLVTERAYPLMTFGMEYKTFRWNFLESIEPPRVVQIITSDILTKENIYAQVTVRFHTKQTLAMYDRFGRLMYGNENLPKDVLEYVVFEKHIANEYGQWRIHGKIIPEWMSSREPLHKTYRKPEFEPIPEDDKKDGDQEKGSQDTAVATA